MKILDRYILKQFVFNLFFCFLAFSVLFIVVDLIEKIDKFIDRDVSYAIIFKFYLYSIPHIFVWSLPVAILLASMFSFGQMAHYNEITVIKASGISLYRIMLAPLVASMIISIFSFYLSETIVPLSNRIRLDLKRVYLERRKPSIQQHRNNIYLRSGMDTRIVIGYFDGSQNTAHKVTVQKIQDNSILERYDAEKMVWEENNWFLKNGTARIFESNGEVLNQFKKIKREDFTFNPEDLIKVQKRPEELNFQELMEFVHKLRTTGGEVNKWLVELHLKIAFPFANFIIVLFGIPLASNKRRSGAAVSFALSFLICFIYIGFIQVGKAIGYQGLLPPMLAAWISNLVFGVLALVLLIRVRK